MLLKKKTQVIKFEQNLCNAEVDENEILFVRAKDSVTCPNAQFEVPTTHDAIVIKGGGDMRYYQSGLYDVFDDKKEVKNWKHGASVDIIYIPKDTRVLIKWGTPNRLRYRDEASNKIISVGARGEFDVSVTNPEQFFRKVVGAKQEFNLIEFKKRFSETVATEFADLYFTVVKEEHLTYDKLMTNKKKMGIRMGEILDKKFQTDWGLSVLNFKISDFDLLDEDIDSMEDSVVERQRKDKLKEYLGILENLQDKKEERVKFLRRLKLEDEDAYNELLNLMNNSDSTEGENICPHCGHKYKKHDKFCPKCGTKIGNKPFICPKCGKANDSSATYCSSCGNKLI